MSHSDSTITTKYDSIYQQLLLDLDECVHKPLLTLCQTEDIEETIQYIESSNLLSRPNSLLTSNLENEVLLEGRSDTASINQARLKNININCNDNNKFPGLLNTEDNDLRIVDVDEIDDIEDISDDDSDEEDEEDGVLDDDTDSNDDDKENNKLLSNTLTHTNNIFIPSDSSTSSSISIDNEEQPTSPKLKSYADEEDMAEQYDSTSSEENTASVSSSSASMSPSSQSSDADDGIYIGNPIKKKKKIQIPLLPLDEINECKIQTNITSEPIMTNRRDSLSIFRNRALHPVQTMIVPEKEQDIEAQDMEMQTESNDVDEKLTETKKAEDVMDVDQLEADDQEEDEEEVDQGGMDADDEREEQEAIENNVEHEEENKVDHVIQDIETEKFGEEKNEWIDEDNDEYITFKRGDDGNVAHPNYNYTETPDLNYIDSFLQSISTLSVNDKQRKALLLEEVNNMNRFEDEIDAEDISVSIHDGDDDNDNEEDNNNGNQMLNDETLEEFRRSELNDYLPNIPRVTNRKKGWWMKYLNSDTHQSDQS